MATIKERNKLIKELKIYISQVITETLRDPDFGLELRKNIKNKLKKIKEGKVKFYTENAVKRRLKL